MNPQPSQTINPDGTSCTMRRVEGPEADEIFVLCGPERAAGGRIESQAESVYRMLDDVLRAEGGGLQHVVHETVFFRNIREDLGEFRQVRDGILRARSGKSLYPASTCIEQPPLIDHERFEVSAFAVIPRRQAQAAGRTVWTTPPCGCVSCLPFATRVFSVGPHEYLYAGNVFGADGSAFDETLSMFSAAEELLRAEGLSFRHVVRTWIHMRDIDRDYGDFNRARREFFSRTGITLHPASTGIAGAPFQDGHNFSMSLYAIKSSEPVEVGLMTTPTLNDAWVYGSDFSRGLKVVEANKVAFYVSGTASIDEGGSTVHVGDFERQVERMILNIETLLAEQNASLRDLVSAITYLKRPADAPMLRRILRDRGLDGVPNALVLAGVCRPELLCEMEAIAALPRSETNRRR